jgi:hypothetical protein
MTARDFHTIRPIRGSVNNGFEELCCQLAQAEPAPPGSRFVRNGTPDGGVEGYRIHDDSQEHGWQAKYFFDIGRTQWKQLDDSVQTAIRTHPALRRYTICLPIDLPDARLDEQTSLRQKWDERVRHWETIAGRRGMSVTFELWGAHEILTRLAAEPHAGRRWFFFNDTELSGDWFRNHLREALAGAGPRYNREFTVELPIALRIDALGYTETFRQFLLAKQEKCYEAAEKVHRHIAPLNTKDALEAAERFTRSDQQLSDRLKLFRQDPPVLGQSEGLRLSLGQVYEAVSEFGRVLYGLADDQPPALRTHEAAPAARPFEYEVLTARQYAATLLRFIEFLDSSSVELTDRPAMLLTGEAGSGKTHLLCDVAKQRIDAGLPTLVLLGQQFDRGDIWRQIIDRLGLACTRDELLGGLEAAAQAAGGRALIFVDAINEAPECDWRNELPRFLEVVSRYRWLGTAVSCRTTYERQLVRSDLVPERCSRVEHLGFAPRLFEAIQTFCQHYAIETLNTPPLNPEFENPLFLKLFCKGLHERGLTRPPKGHHGLQRIFQFLIDSVNEKLHYPNELDYPENDRIVQRAIDAIAGAMVKGRTNFLPRALAQSTLEEILPSAGRGYSKSLLAKLVAEGILADDLRGRRKTASSEPIVRFGYERFADFQLARRLLDEQVQTQNAEAAFAPDGFFGRIFADETKAARFRGLLSALIVLVPERLGRELAEFLPSVVEWYDYRHAFLEALPWREGRHITAHATQYVESLIEGGEHGSAYHSLADDAWERIIQLAALPDHPLNARWLHATLHRLSMPERDVRWSMYLHRSERRQESKSPSAMTRLLDWAWPDDAERIDPIAGCDDEVIELAAATVVWCFTTANRFVRDRATKALVCLLRGRLHLVPGILDAFQGVDDLYVSERLYAACFGSVVRDSRIDQVQTVAKATYDNVFSSGEPPAHLLLRDYAREIIEYAAFLGCTFEFAIGNARPPYRSTPPPETAPTWKALHTVYDDGYGGLVLSLWPDHGDFARYVMRSDSSGLHTWVSAPDPYAEVRRLDAARVELPQDLAARWWKIEHARMLNLHDLPDLAGTQTEDAENSFADAQEEQSDEENDGARSDYLVARSRFLDSLLPEERELIDRYEAALDLHQKAMDQAHEAERRLHSDAQLPCCWVMTRVIELGWTPERFAEFDDQVMRNDTREAKKAERIGKKYQWIAYHELAARVTDHRPFNHDYYSEPVRYAGPWQRSFRNIDPTCLAKFLPSDRTDSSWWVPIPDPFHAAAELEDQAWLLDTATVPDFTGLISVDKPGETVRWLNLHCHSEWKNERPKEEESRYSRRISFSLGSFLVRSCETSRFLADVSNGEWTGMEVSCPEFHDQFLGEYFWAPSFGDIRSDATAGLTNPVDDSTIQRISLRTNGSCAARPVAQYGFSSGFDCSAQEAVRGYMPSVWLASRMGLSWRRRGFSFVDASGRVVAVDPSHEEPGPGAFLIEEEAMRRFLAANKLTLVWLLIGEKMLADGGPGGPDDRSSPRVSVFRQVYELGAGVQNPIWRTLGHLGDDGATY